jgi:hypothetical protein
MANGLKQTGRRTVRFVPPALRAVEDAYRRTNGPVAYLDESYQAPDKVATHAQTFYIFTAVVVNQKNMDIVRAELAVIADDTRWHTSDALMTEVGRERTVKMLEYLAEGPEPCVIAHRVSVDLDDRDAERARRSCYRGLAVEMAAGRTGAWDPIELLVLEERNQRNLKNKDAANHRELVAEQLLPRNTRLLQISPAIEHLLWLPDLVSSAFRRTITHPADSTGSLFDLIKDQVHFVTPDRSMETPP